MTNSSLDHLKGSSKKNISCHLKKVLSQPYSVFIHVPTFNQYVLNPLNHFKYKVRGVGTIFFWFFNGICASLMAMNEIQRNSSHREFLRWDIDKSCRLKWTTMVVDMMGELRALAWPQFSRQGSIWGRFFLKNYF